MNRAESRKEFMARWNAYGSRLFNRAEAHGLDWRRMPMEQLSASVILAEEWAAPEEHKTKPEFSERFPINP